MIGFMSDAIKAAGTIEGMSQGFDLSKAKRL